MDNVCQKEESSCSFAERAADIAVRRTFAILGVDVDSPESVEEFRVDLRFGKKLRKASDQGYFILAAAFFGGIATAIWHGIQEAIRRTQ